MYRPEGRHFKEIPINLKVRAKIIYYSLYSGIPAFVLFSFIKVHIFPSPYITETDKHTHTHLSGVQNISDCNCVVL